MLVRPITDEEAEQIFGSRLVISCQKRHLPLKQSAETSESNSATEPTPVQPAVDAIEEWGRKTFVGVAKGGSQEEHDRWFQSQSDSQMKNLARNTADLMCAKGGSGARIRFPTDASSLPRSLATNSFPSPSTRSSRLPTTARC